MDVRQAARRIVEAAASNRVAVLFGNEHNGLTNRELDECGLVLTIPSNPGFPVPEPRPERHDRGL